MRIFSGVSMKPVRVFSKAIKNWSEMKSVLVKGDIVGIQKDGRCVLLTPWQDAEPADTQSILEKLERQKKWNTFIQEVNQFFEKREFLAVQTPTLVSNPGPEPTIDAFKTGFKNGRFVSDKFLITSPELHLKKILAQTLAPIYEITKVYRNNEHSPKHEPEFWMLEWYRPFADLNVIADDVKELIQYLHKALKIKKTLQFENTTFQKILKKKYGFSFQPSTTADQLKSLLKKNNIYFSDAMGLDDLFTLVNIEMIETNLNSKKIVFLSDYPPYAAALAKLDQKGWAQRFEVYWQGLELGNAFHELNDPDIQEQRLVDDNQKKKDNGLDPLPIDQDFLRSLRQGMPPGAGISIGLERLFMSLYQEKQIQNIKWFSVKT